MKVLILARCKNGQYAPFITEQVEAIKKEGVECQYFGVEGKGVWGYLWHLPKLKRAIREYKPDIIHAHYGLCGLLANMQRKVPVVTTYHGSDINNPKVLKFSKIAIRRSRFNIFVSQKNIDTAGPKKDFALIPCGINLEDYPVMEKAEARRQMGLDADKKYVLFAGAFDNPVKNAALAKEAMQLVPEAELLDLKGYNRQQVATLMQAVDAFLMTSHTEGSPQVIKEAMACGCPIVSVDVGDVKEKIHGLEGCYISDYNPLSVSESISQALAFGKRTHARKTIRRDGLENITIAKKVVTIYQEILDFR